MHEGPRSLGRATCSSGLIGHAALNLTWYRDGGGDLARDANSSYRQSEESIASEHGWKCGEDVNIVVELRLLHTKTISPLLYTQLVGLRCHHHMWSGSRICVVDILHTLDPVVLTWKNTILNILASSYKLRRY